MSFDQLKQAVKGNPDLPITWEQVVELDPKWDKTPDQKKKLIADLENIQSTEVGQNLLREILLTKGRTDKVKIISAESLQELTDAVPSSTRAIYSNGDNAIFVGTGLYGESDLAKASSSGIEQGKQLEDAGSSASFKSISTDQYLLHELAHAAVMGPQAFKDANLKTMQDQILFIGNQELEAEKMVDRYSDDTGAKKRGAYMGEDVISLSAFSLRESLNNPAQRAKEVESFVKGVVKYAKADLRLDDAETLKFLDKEVAKLKEDGMDITTDVQNFLKLDARMDDAAIIPPAKEGPTFKPQSLAMAQP